MKKFAFVALSLAFVSGLAFADDMGMKKDMPMKDDMGMKKEMPMDDMKKPMEEKKDMM